EAAVLTRRRTSARTVPTGMPKFAAYRDIDFAKLRAHTRAKLNVGLPVTVIALFTQPLWETPGYFEAMQAAVDTAKCLDGELCLIIRAHPSDRSGRIDEVSRRAAGSG